MNESQIVDIFNPRLSFTVEEANGEVDGEYILGRVRGEFFCPNGYSRNKRYYSKSLWDKQLQNEGIKEKLKDRRMFGTIGHDQILDDKGLRDGKASHVVTNLSIENGKGIGEVLILGTPAGKVLNTMIRAKCKFFVSSRADGDYSGKKNGADIVDEDSYKLQGFDFVADPGFLQANPKLVESLGEDYKDVFGADDKFLITESEEENKEKSKSKEVKEDNENNKDVIEENDKPLKNEFNNFKEIKRRKEMDNKMDNIQQSLLESVIQEKSAVSVELGNALSEVDNLKSQLVAATSESEILKQEAEDKANKEVEAYKALGTVGELTEKIKAADEIQLKLKELEVGDIEEVASVLTEGIETLKNIKEKFGTVGEIEKSIVELKEYEDLTSVEDLKSMISIFEKYVELGSHEDISEMVSIFEKYVELGSPSDIEELVTVSKGIFEKLQNDKDSKEIMRISKEISVSEDIVGKLYGKMDESEIKETLNDIAESNKVRDRFGKQDVNEDGKSERKTDKGRGKWSTQTSGQRLQESV